MPAAITHAAHGASAAAALVLAALAAGGRTDLTGVEHLCRGCENLPGTLRSLGAHIIEEEL